MKKKNLLLSLALAGMCFSQASAQAPRSSRHLGDSGTVAASSRLGDGLVATNVEGDQPDETYDNAKLVSQSKVMDYQMLAPTSSAFSTNCDCGGAACGGSCGSFNNSCRTQPKHWLTAESLLWFASDQRTPSLATTSAQSVLPISGAQGVTDAFGGGDGLDAGLLPGFRLSAGTYLGDCDKIGVGGRVFGIFSNANEFNASSDGSTSLGVPFFNASGTAPPNVSGSPFFNGPGSPDAYLVGYTAPGGVPVSAGSISARSDLDMIGAEGSLYFLLSRSKSHRIDMVGGYSFNKLKNSVSLVTESVNLFTGDLIPNGTEFTTNDLFATENVFHGGHLGVLSTVLRNRVSLSTLTKVSFGNMHQSAEITGSTVQDDGVNVANFLGGLFAQQSNIGSYSRDTFAFIPEAGVKLGYSLSEHCQLTVGYTFMMWSGVALAGDQMDPSLDLTQVGATAGSRPAVDFRDTVFWMQGVDLGLSWTY